jgi:thioredoxin-like negative regulator of GroEL
MLPVDGSANLTTRHKRLAKKHRFTKFVKVNVDKCPFLVERLKIRVLPCLISFVDGVTVDR